MKTLSILAAFALTICLTSCGGKDKPADTTATAPTTDAPVTDAELTENADEALDALAPVE